MQDGKFLNIVTNLVSCQSLAEKTAMQKMLAMYPKEGFQASSIEDKLRVLLEFYKNLYKNSDPSIGKKNRFWINW